MIDLIVDFLGNVLFFFLGRFYLRLLTFGRYNPSRDDCKNPLLVSLFGFLITFILVIGTVLWFKQAT